MTLDERRLFPPRSKSLSDTRAFDPFLYESDLRSRVSSAGAVVDSAAQLAFRMLWPHRRPASVLAGMAVRDELLRLVGVMRTSRG